MSVAVPAVSPPRPVVGDGVLAEMLRWERADGLYGRAAYPAFHVTWAFIAAGTLASRLRQVGWAAAFFPWIWAIALAASCITSGMHALADIPAGILLWVVAWWWRPIMRVLAMWCERLANSWREWRFGPIRIISHAAFAGIAAAVGALIIIGLAGVANTPAVLLIAATALVGAGLWGQLFVKRPTSARPFGYFGCVLGGTIGVGLTHVLGYPFWPLAAAFTVAAPWIQAIGRLRCLVQGCCHGRQTDSPFAILYRHPKSRVCRASNLAGTPVHPTPLYSILGNIAIGVLLARLWEVRASFAIVAGLYLVLAGMLRFVEEHYRGEPHTPIVWGLRIYQWFSVLSILVGLMLSSLTAESPTTNWAHSTSGLLVSLLVGGLFAFAMGVDFPDSNRRFARLA